MTNKVYRTLEQQLVVFQDIQNPVAHALSKQHLLMTAQIDFL